MKRPHPSLLLIAHASYCAGAGASEAGLNSAGLRDVLKPGTNLVQRSHGKASLRQILELTRWVEGSTTSRPAAASPIVKAKNASSLTGLLRAVAAVAPKAPPAASSKPQEVTAAISEAQQHGQTRVHHRLAESSARKLAGGHRQDGQGTRSRRSRAKRQPEAVSSGTPSQSHDTFRGPVSGASTDAGSSGGARGMPRKASGAWGRLLRVASAASPSGSSEGERHGSSAGPPAQSAPASAARSGATVKSHEKPAVPALGASTPKRGAGPAVAGPPAKGAAKERAKPTAAAPGGVVGKQSARLKMSRATRLLMSAASHHSGESGKTVQQQQRQHQQQQQQYRQQQRLSKEEKDNQNAPQHMPVQDERSDAPEQQRAIAGAAAAMASAAVAPPRSRPGGPDGAGTPANVSARIHFLFLQRDTFSFPRIWSHFFQQAPQGTAKVWVHCFAHCHAEDPNLSMIPDVHLVPTVPSEHCKDLVSPMVQLARRALSSDPAPAGWVEKFVYVSDTTLPIKPFSVVLQTLAAANTSDICLQKKEAWASIKQESNEAYLVRHSQWVSLTRGHLSSFVDEWPLDNTAKVDFRRHFIKFNGPWGHERHISRSKFDKIWHCADEEAVFAGVFGAYAPGVAGMESFHGFGSLELQESHVYHGRRGRCRTLSAWNVTSDPVASALLEDPELELVSNKMPLEISHLGTVGMRVLRSMPFLFMRKFAFGAKLPGFTEEVLSDEVVPGSTHQRTLKSDVELLWRVPQFRRRKMSPGAKPKKPPGQKTK